jgi:hypothetical protein
VHVRDQGTVISADGEAMAIAVEPATTVKTLRLTRPFVRSTVESTAVAGLFLSAAGLWLLVIPIELLGLVA